MATMNVRQIAVLGVALLAGLGAFVMMMTNKKAGPVQIVQPAQEKTVRILVADAPLNRGQRLTADVMKWIEWPQKALSESYITEASGKESSDFEGAVARTSIVAGEPIIESKIVRVGSSGLMAAVLDPGMRAVTMRISPETGVAGFVLPGDHVDIYYSQGGGKANTELLFADVRVLAINTVFNENPEAPVIEGGTATVQMTPQDAEYFINTRASRGQMSFALRSVFPPSEEEGSTKKNQGVRVIRYGRS